MILSLYYTLLVCDLEFATPQSILEGGGGGGAGPLAPSIRQCFLFKYILFCYICKYYYFLNSRRANYSVTQLFNSIQFNSIHAFISDKIPYYTGYINYNHRLLIIN